MWIRDKSGTLRNMTRIDTHDGSFFEIHLYPPKPPFLGECMNVYRRTREQIAACELATDCDERFGGWTINDTETRKLRRLFET